MKREREFALEALEVIHTVEEAWDILRSVNADLDDKDVLYHLSFNPHITYTDLELSKEG